MKSDRKIKANRANARMSTGPKTRHGRARSAKNAFRHGLSLTVQSDQALCEEVQALALQIAGRDASAHNQMLARQVAEAQIDLRRIRYVRRQFLSEALADRYRYESRALTRMKVKVIKQFLKLLGASNLSHIVLDRHSRESHLNSFWLNVFHDACFAFQNGITAYSDVIFDSDLPGQDGTISD